jgi:hypothetical protein
MSSMGKMGWVIVVVLLFLLFRDKITGAVNSVTRPTFNPSNYYGAPPPGPNYAASPPISQSGQVSDVINHAISAGMTLYQGWGGSSSSPSPSSPSGNYGNATGDGQWARHGRRRRPRRSGAQRCCQRRAGPGRDRLGRSSPRLRDDRRAVVVDLVGPDDG